jgi:adenine deaminase
MKLFILKLGVLLLLAAGFTSGLVPAQEKTEQQRAHEAQPATAAMVIVNAQVSDGSEAPLKKVSVRIAGDRITKIGVFKPAKGEQIIDAQGLVLAPGFIDIHNHSAEGLDKDPLA